MKSRTILAAAIVSSALVTGGWLMERGGRGAPATREARARLFDEVFRRLKRDYVDTLSDSALYRHAVDGVLRELHDPHTVFLDAARLSRLTESTSGRYAGVGIQMDLRDSGITVTTALPGSPAERAGITTGDRIVRIGARPTVGLTPDEAVRAIRGPPGTTVRLVVERPGLASPLPFTLVRREIAVNPVRHALLLPSGVGFVDLSVFSSDAAADLAQAIDSLRRQGARQLVLDLRGNPGGLLDQGVGVADLFLQRGQTIVATRGRLADENRSFTDREDQRWPTLPLVVLTDSGSASASEIVAGALQDHDRALLVGTTTYGKGSAQRLFRIQGGALKMTTALWYTPSGRSIDRRARSTDDDSGEERPPADTVRPRFRSDAGRIVLGGGGIVPDVEVARTPPSEGEKALQSALGTRVASFRDAISGYALSLRGSGEVRSPEFVVSPAMRDELYRRLQGRGVAITRSTYDRASTLIDRLLTSQILRYVFGPREEFERGLRDDPVVARALELARGAATPQELLQRVPPRPGGR